MATAGILQSICLPLLSVYQLSSNGGGQVSGGSPETHPGEIQAPGCWLVFLFRGLTLLACAGPRFLSAVSGRPVVARRLSPLRIADGAPAEDPPVQLPDRCLGLRGCPSGEDPSGGLLFGLQGGRGFEGGPISGIWETGWPNLSFLPRACPSRAEGRGAS